MRLTLGQRILAITAAALIPILGVLTFNEFALRESRERELQELALATARQAAIEMERLTSGAAGILKAIASAPAVTGFDADLCRPFLARLKTDLPQFTVILVTDLSGEARCRSDDAPAGMNYADRSYFKDALAADGRLVIGEAVPSRTTGKLGLPLALAILDEQRKPIGMVATGLNLEWLGSSLRERKLPENSSLTIADRNGMIIAREPFPERFVGTAIPEAFRHLVTADAPGAIEVTSQDGTRRILGYIPASVPPTNLYISAGISRDEGFEAIDDATTRSVAVSVTAAAGAAFLAWFLGQSLVRGPVTRIASTLAARRAGDEGRRTGMRPSEGELEALGSEFDTYMDELNANRLERERVERELATLAKEKDQLARHNELLAREMSHRIMNSFQLMEGIFGLQSRRITDPEARKLVEEAGERVRSMALVHRQLFQLTRDDMNNLDAAGYLRGLAEELARAFVTGERSTIHVDAVPGVLVSPGQSIALGLLVTELVINACKHAFRGTQGGAIHVRFHPIVGDRRLLIVEDDGAGLPRGFDVAESKGVGMRLVQSFVRQLDGELQVEGPPGARFIVTFPN